MSPTSKAVTLPFPCPLFIQPVLPESLGGTKPAAQQRLNQPVAAEKRQINRAGCCPCFALLSKGRSPGRDFILSSSSLAFFFAFPFPADSHQLKGPLSWCKARRWPSTSPPHPSFQRGHHPPSSQDPSWEKSRLGHCIKLCPEDFPLDLLHGPASGSFQTSSYCHATNLLEIPTR